jgi:hypothetical protein
MAGMTSATMEPGTTPSEAHEPWYTRVEAAAYLDIHPNTLDEKRRQGKIRPIYITERNIRYPLSELQRYVQQQQTLEPLPPPVLPPAPDPRLKRRRARPWTAPQG